MMARLGMLAAVPLVLSACDRPPPATSQPVIGQARYHPVELARNAQGYLIPSCAQSGAVSAPRNAQGFSLPPCTRYPAY